MAGHGQQLARAPFRDPPLEGERTGVAVRRLRPELRSRPAVPDDLPRIRRRLRLVDDDRRGGALPGGLLVLVGPAPVVGHRVALEQRRVLRGEPRVIDQDQHGLAPHVHVGVVVPAVLGRHDAIADENDFTGFHLRFGHHPRRAGDHFVLVPDQTVLAVEVKGHLHGGGVGFDRDQVDRLQVAVAEQGLQPEFAEARLDELQRQALALRHRDVLARPLPQPLGQRHDHTGDVALPHRRGADT